MNNSLPLYDVQELSLEELVQLMVQQNRPAVNDVVPSEKLNFEELAVLLRP